MEAFHMLIILEFVGQLMSMHYLASRILAWPSRICPFCSAHQTASMVRHSSLPIGVVLDFVSLRRFLS
jgi:hypothetical protein